MKKIAFETLGCKLNFAETSTIASKMEGYQRVDFKQPADVYVINTCAVTQNAERKLKEIIRQAKKRNPQAKIVTLGCLTQLDPHKVAQFPYVDLVLGMEEKYKLHEYLPGLLEDKIKGVHSCETNARETFHSAFSIGDRTRAFLKIQDGCDYPCTYCTIPLARGKGRNPTVEQIVQNARKIATSGIKEIVLTGVNIGTFIDTSTGKKRTFFDLIQALDQVEGIERYRISSIEPNLLTDEIIEYVLTKSPKFLPHFHIPLQSGSNEILGKMRRRYRRELYEQKVQKIRSISSDASIGVDVIVGFPGETDELFEETYRFLKFLPVSYFHVFTYSERPNTLAASMPGKVPGKVRAERSRKLRELSKRKELLFAESQLGKTKSVLFERSRKNNMMTGWTENYLRVVHPYDESLVNQISEVKLLENSPEGITVQILSTCLKSST